MGGDWSVQTLTQFLYTYITFIQLQERTYFNQSTSENFLRNAIVPAR